MKSLGLIIIALIVGLLNANYVFQNTLNVTQFYQDQFQEKIHHEFYVGHLEVGPSVENSHSRLFYQLVLAKDKTLKSNHATTILWLQGGPGCSSQIGNYQEFGPYFINQKDGKPILVDNQYSWANDFNLVFVDQPIGVGFSVIVGEQTPYPGDTVTAAEYLEQFLVQFFQTYPNLKANDFYVFGESYAGHYIPALAAKLVKSGSVSNFKGIGVGDGMANPLKQAPVYSEYGYASGIISGGRRKKYQMLENGIVQDLLRNKYIDASHKYDVLTNNDTDYSMVIIAGNIDQTNYRKYINGPGTDDYMTQWLQQDSIRSTFNIPSNVTYSMCSDPIYRSFANDFTRSYESNYTDILASDLRVLIYQGQDDLVIPTQGIYHMLNSLEWGGEQGFIKAQKELWIMDNMPVGWKKSYQNLNFVLVNKAGHLLPGDQPKVTQNLVKDFINNV